MTVNLEELRGLVERLRQAGNDLDERPAETLGAPHALWGAAANLESLAAENERLREALEQIERGTVDTAFGAPIKITTFRMQSIARKALGGSE